MSKRPKMVLSLLILCLIPVSAQKLGVSGRVTKLSNGIFYVDCDISEEGHYEIHRAASVTSRFWTTLTNFYALPGKVTVADAMTNSARFYRLTRLTNPPSITVQPLGATNYSGTEIKLTAGVTGSAPLRLRWFKDGRALDTATTTNLSFTGVPNLSGVYSLVATNPWGVVTSAVAPVKITAAIAPAISGKTIRFTIENAQGEFVGSGNFTTVFNAQGYYNTSGSSPLLNDTGYWLYGALSDTRARILLPGSVAYPDGSMTLTFTDPQNGSYNLAVPGRFGFQSGRFQLLD